MVEQGEADAVDRLEQRQLYLLANKSVVIESSHKASLRNHSAVNSEWDRSRAEREVKFAQRHALERVAEEQDPAAGQEVAKMHPVTTSQPNDKVGGPRLQSDDVRSGKSGPASSVEDEEDEDAGGTPRTLWPAQKDDGQHETDEEVPEQLPTGTPAPSAVLEEQIQKAVADERARISAENSRTVAELQHALQQQVALAQQERERSRALESHAQREAVRAQQFERDTRTMREDLCKMKQELDAQTEKMQRQSEEYHTAEDHAKKRDRRRKRALKKAIAALEKRQQEKTSLAFRQTKLWLSMSARVVETVANATNFNLIRLRGLASDLDSQLEKGHMDPAISTYADSQSALTFLTNPLASLVANLLNVVTETHLSNLEEEKTAVPGPPLPPAVLRPRPPPTGNVAAPVAAAAATAVPEPIRHSLHGGVPQNLLARREKVDFVAPRPNALLQQVSSTVGALAPLLVHSKTNEELKVERQKLDEVEDD